MTKLMMRGSLEMYWDHLIIVGPPGSGKTTTLRWLLRMYPFFKPVPSYTTKPFRDESERWHEGAEYIHVSDQRFDEIRTLNKILKGKHTPSTTKGTHYKKGIPVRSEWPVLLPGEKRLSSWGRRATLEVIEMLDLNTAITVYLTARSDVLGARVAERRNNDSIAGHMGKIKRPRSGESGFDYVIDTTKLTEIEVVREVIDRVGLPQSELIPL